MTVNEIVLVVGIQGSGKSTTVKPLVERGYVRFNRDQMGKSTSMATVLAAMGTAITQKKSAVLDNTYCTAENRKPFIGAAKKAGYKVRAMVMATSFEDAQYNVVQRIVRNNDGNLIQPEDFKDRKEEWAVPPGALFKYRKAYQVPRSDEGFDSIEMVPFKRTYGPEYKNSALIVDKDGTLTECISGAKYPCLASDVKLCGRREKDKLAYWKAKGYLLLGASTQSGVAKGDITLTEMARIFDKTNKLVGHDIDWNYCPHNPPPRCFCYCRKPASGMGVLHIEKYKLNPSACMYVGDMTTDKTFAGRCGFEYVDAAKFFA